MFKYLSEEEVGALYEEMFVLPNHPNYVEQDWIREDDEEKVETRIVEEDDEKTSVFQMINDAKDIFRQNYYQDTGENISDVIRGAKRLVWGKSKMDSNNLADLVSVFKYAIEKIYANHFTVESYFSHWGSQLNRRMGLEGLILQIANAAPDNIKTECCFDQKRIVLKITYPELYERSMQSIDSLDIWNASGEIKAGLIRNARVDVQAAGISDVNSENAPTQDKKPSKTYGGMVDKIIYDAITEIFKSFGYNIEAAFEWCSNWQKNNSGGKEPGFLSVIKARGCYAHLLDFYFLNSPPMAQVEYFNYYMKLRDAAEIPHNVVLDAMLKIAEDAKYEMYETQKVEKKVANKETGVYLKDKNGKFVTETTEVRVLTDWGSIEKAVANETKQSYFDDPYYVSRGNVKISLADFEKITNDHEEDAYEAG